MSECNCVPVDAPDDIDFNSTNTAKICNTTNLTGIG